MVMFLLKYWRVGLAAALLIAAFGSGWYVRAKIAAADMAKVQAELQEAVDAQRARADDAAASFEVNREAVDRQAYDTRTIIEREYRNVEVASSCAVPEPVANSLQQAVEGSNRAASGIPAPAVP